MISIYNKIAPDLINHDIAGMSQKKVTIYGYDGNPMGNGVKDDVILYITGLLKELPSIAYSNEWALSPLAKVDEKLKEFFSKEILNSIASLSSEGYNTPVATDEWTQLFPKDGSTLKFDLSFTSYYKDTLETTNYFKIIEQLLIALTPNKHRITDYADITQKATLTAVEAGKGYKSLISDKTGLDGLMYDIKKEVFSGVENLIKAAFGDNDVTSTKEIAEESLIQAKAAIKSIFANVEKLFESNGNTGGPCRFRMSIPNIIDTIKNDVNWYFYITNFTFKPSINTVNYKDKNVPISMDINITLESDRVLNNKDVSDALINS